MIVPSLFEMVKCHFKSVNTRVLLVSLCLSVPFQTRVCECGSRAVVILGFFFCEGLFSPAPFFSATHLCFPITPEKLRAGVFPKTIVRQLWLKILSFKKKILSSGNEKPGTKLECLQKT